MKIIIPMAGRGTRLRPHTLTVPKPLIPVAGTPIVHRLVKDIAMVLNQPIEEIAFVLGDKAFFGDDIRDSLISLAEELRAKPSIYYQDKPMGTGHAILTAKESLSGSAVIAYADTLFTANFDLDSDADGIIWTKEVTNPSQYGVVKLNAKNHITELVEKPKEFVSNQAVIGIYYFKDVSVLKNKLEEVLEENIIHGGEYQINDGIKKMMADGNVFNTKTVNGWFDCGNKKITVQTNQEILKLEKDKKLIHDDAIIENSIIISPCFIGPNSKIKNSVIGPYVSIGKETSVNNSLIKNSIIQNKSSINNVIFKDSMVGNQVNFNGNVEHVSLGDFSSINLGHE